ncbi:hypothetical protein P3S67_032302 [Capsicum chacoense]|uniref:uncharacterized protein LOC124891182 n=1 Tax=Capsicum annuum TaxID=4072 RepID=UPI001FB0741B|nr:uncharacterized protein LOC124891182 [Capsicum annuum]
MGITDLIWNAISLPKQRFILWLAVHSKLLTKERLIKMNIPVDEVVCCLCDKKDLEINHHLFVTCSWFCEVRNEMMQWTGIKLPAVGIKQVLEVVKNRHWRKFVKEIVAALISGMVYYAWRARNWRLFKKINISPSDAVARIKYEVVARIDIFKLAQKFIRSRSFHPRLCV